MGLSKEQICNRALNLARIEGVPDLDDVTNTKVVSCNDFFEDSLEFCLVDIKPNFSWAKASLTLDTAKPEHQYSNQFSLPTDFLDILTFNSLLPSEASDSYAQYGTKLLTDESSAKIDYIFKENSTGNYSPIFRESLIYYLSHKLCLRLSNEEKRAMELLRMYNSIFRTKAITKESTNSKRMREEKGKRSRYKQKRYT